ncbi:MAG: M28 family peptidase [Verrucomicrobiia bacterium]
MIDIDQQARPKRHEAIYDILFVVGICLILVGCESKRAPALYPDNFSGTNAYAQVEQLVAFGPRPSGSAELTKSGDYIAALLRKSGLTVEEQTFTAQTPHGPIKFRNIIGRTRMQRGGGADVIIIGSHYDTKWFDRFRFVGANDGGSSTGVLLELARSLSCGTNFWFVFFDGEEAMVEYSAGDGLWGSKHFVAELKRTGQAEQIKAMVLLDMVGATRLNIGMPSNGDGALIQQVFDAARAAGTRDHFEYRGGALLDDHEPFLEAGIPAVDLIDFTYGSRPGLNDYWHTDQDTLDKISPQSLEIVGQTTLRLLDSLMRHGPPR